MHGKYIFLSKTDIDFWKENRADVLKMRDSFNLKIISQCLKDKL